MNESDNSPKFSLDEPTGVVSEKSGNVAGTLLAPEMRQVAPPEAPREAPGDHLKQPPRRYAYRKLWVRSVFRLVDRLGDGLFGGSRTRPETIGRVLVMRPDHLGDVLFSFPVLKALREKLPDAHIDLLVGPWASPLVPDDSKELYGVNLLEFAAPWLMRPKKLRLGLIAALRLAWRLRRRARELGGPYDMVIDLRGDFQLILAARLAGVRYLAGRGLTGLGFLLDVEEEEVKGRHQVENNLALAEAAGFGPLETSNPKVNLSKEDIEQARAFLRDNSVDGSKILIGVHVGAGVATKCWGADKYGQLINRVVSDLPAQVILLGGPDDRQAVDDVLIALKGSKAEGRVLDFCEKLPTLRSFMGVARQCVLFIGNDSGPGHIAAALGVPLISVFSATNDPVEWGPRGSSIIIVRKRIDCEGCGLTVCDHHSCMVQLDSDVVYQAVRRCV